MELFLEQTIFRACAKIFRAGATIFRAGATIFRAGATIFKADATIFTVRMFNIYVKLMKSSKVFTAQLKPTISWDNVTGFFFFQFLEKKFCT